MQSEINEFLNDGVNDDEVFDSLSISSGHHFEENLMDFSKKKKEFEKMLNKGNNEEDEDEILIVKKKTPGSSRYETHHEEEEDYEEYENYDDQARKNPYDSDDSVEDANKALNTSAFDPNNSYKHFMAVPKFTAGSKKLSSSEAKLYGLLDQNGGFKLKPTNTNPVFDKKKMMALSKPKEVYKKDSISVEENLNMKPTKTMAITDFKFDSKLYRPKTEHTSEEEDYDKLPASEKKKCPKCNAIQTYKQLEERIDECENCKVRYVKKVHNPSSFASKLKDYDEKTKLKQLSIDYNTTKFYGRTGREIDRIKLEEEFIDSLVNKAKAIGSPSTTKSSRRNSFESESKGVVNSRRDSKASKMVESVIYTSITMQIVSPKESDQENTSLFRKSTVIIPFEPSLSPILLNLFNHQLCIESNDRLLPRIKNLLKGTSSIRKYDPLTSIPIHVQLPPYNDDDPDFKQENPTSSVFKQRPVSASAVPKPQPSSVHRPAPSQLRPSSHSESKPKSLSVSQAPDAKDVPIKGLDAKTVAEAIIQANNEKAKLIEKNFNNNNLKSSSTASKMERLVNY